MCCKSRGGLARLGLMLGLLGLGTLVMAFINGNWLTTKEPIMLKDSRLLTSIHYKIGLFKECHHVKRPNSSIHVPQPGCSPVKYGVWDNVTSSDLGVSTPLELAPVFISRMRSCTLLTGSAVILLLVACFFALLGQCNTDNKTLIACGFFILGGLSLGTGLVVFASALSETLMEISEITEYHREPSSGADYDYRYGWCFFTAGAAFIMTKMAAAFSLSGYLNRFPSVDEMVREMVPGAERKLREHQHLSSDYLLKHTIPPPKQYDFLPEVPKYEQECGPLLNKTPPDVCTTNKSVEFAVSEPASALSGVIEHNYGGQSSSLAGQTVPITIKNATSSTAPLSYFPMNKYGTMPHGAGGQGPMCNSTGQTPHMSSYSTLPHNVQLDPALNHPFHSIAEHENCKALAAGGFCAAKSKTLQHPRPKKKVKIETFQSPPDTTFVDFGSKRTNTVQFSGSAV